MPGLRDGEDGAAVVKVGDVVVINQYGQAVLPAAAGNNALSAGRVTHIHSDKRTVSVELGHQNVKDFVQGHSVYQIPTPPPTSVEVMEESLCTET